MLTILIISAMYGYRAPALDKVDIRCYEEPYAKVWVYFTDKGIPADKYAAVLRTVAPNLSHAALNRRLTRGGVIDFADLPVNRDYIAEVEARGGILVRQSRWLNAASFWVRRDDLPDISGSAAVFKITPVAGFGPSRTLETVTAAEDTLVYGMAYHQLKMFNIDKLHEKTVYGSGVIVGVMDTGLKLRHNALNAVKVIGQYDFFGGDRIYARGTPGLGEAAVTGTYGVYGEVEFHQSASGRLYLFLSGDTVYNNQPVRDLLFTFSDDGGDTWLPDPHKLTQNFNNWVNDVTVCGRDTIFVFYHNSNGINYLVLADTIIITQPVLWPNPVSREPSAVQLDDTVYVFYQSRNRLFIRKGNYGGGFGIETSVDSIAWGSVVKYPKAVSGVQKIGVFYHTLFGDSLFFLRDSVPVGSFAKKFLHIGKDAEAMTAGDTVFMIWKDLAASPLTRVGFAKSSDFGATYSAPVFLSDDVAALGKISIARDASALTVAWETEGRIYSRTSLDNGDAFGGLDSLGLGFTYLPTLAKTGSGIIKFYVTRGDTITDDLTTQPNHGTEMLGLIGGYSQNLYRGVAPGVQFLVAKTEIRDSVYEYPIEEDAWVCGLEWLESRGADIVNSSLGYLKWYRWPDDYDGKTSPASIAGYEAYRRGMIVVTAAGNVYPNQLVAPGDAEGVITVGGIDTLFQRWEFSGHGPTADGRRKPEVVSLAKATVVVEPDSSGSYLLSTGTSGATAMVSGMCALLLEVHPNWTPDSVRHALFTTAHYANSPTDSMGFGWPDVYAAANLSPWWRSDTLFGNAFLPPYPNPFTTGTETRIYLPFKLSASCYVTFRVYSIAGRLIRSEERTEQLLPGRYTSENPLALDRAFSWDGRDEAGNLVGSGLYYCALITTSGQNAIAKIAVVR